eukprot:TRINITY_DN16837_c0_g1_i21.p1 TRINITY_DN16837_c0_g1~~TRINITY_DN16837_c0_g1_i21.p1  ORF type:complete len:697 (-),score=123.62 TRINITY_DN16837_c0_g1_i21:336-2426(-)
MPWSTGHRGEWIEIYSYNISTQYSEVYWTTQPAIRLPADFVSRFRGKIVALTGYEVDSVRTMPNGTETSVPITEQYNHHHNAYLMGAAAKMVDVGPGGSRRVPSHGGLPSRWEPRLQPGTRSAAIDGQQVMQTAFIVDGNGGEYRKSFHGTAAGFAMLVQDPDHFVLEPMMINTKNPDGSSTPGGPLPKSSLAPAHAEYSGLLECPCTNRKKKVITSATTQESGVCATQMPSPTSCFTAVSAMGLTPITANSTVFQSTLPAGCTVMVTQLGFEATFNTDASSSVPCGPANSTALIRSLGSDVIANVTVKLDLSAEAATARITLSGPAEVWFGAGFGGTEMQGTYGVVVLPNQSVVERTLGLHTEGSVLPPSVKLLSSSVTDSIRTVVLERALTGTHYSFDPAAEAVSTIAAVGSTASFSYHKTRSSSMLMLVRATGPACVCSGGTTGSIDGVAFNNHCQAQPLSDLAALKNDVCFIETYGGGLKCCAHKSILLDSEQHVPMEVDTYRMKFRLYFEEYTSQQNAFFMFWTNEQGAGEYDVPRCAAGTPPSLCVYTTTSTFQVRQSMHRCHSMADPWCAANWNETAGVMLLRAGTHCHAPACIGTKLYVCPGQNATSCNEDTGELLCANTPIYGEGRDPRFDEPGYVAIPPCLWGPPPLQPPPRLGLDTLLHSVKINNNTNGHWGVMGQWQMRGAWAV